MDNKAKTPYLCEIDLNNITNDTFNVVLHIDNLTEANNVFHFPSTVAGVYETLNFGRYGSSFKSFDKSNKEISVEHNSINQWTISKPNDVSVITYKAAETFTFATHYGSNIDSDAILY
jgi:predicted metalloprotease with PDZ domain